MAGGRRGEQQPEVAVHDRDAVGAGLDEAAEVLLAADEVLGDPAVLADAEDQAHGHEAKTAAKPNSAPTEWRWSRSSIQREGRGQAEHRADDEEHAERADLRGAGPGGAVGEAGGGEAGRDDDGLQARGRRRRRSPPSTARTAR